MRASRANFPLWCAAVALLSSPLAAAADSRAQYQEERAACMQLEAGESRTTCLREAGAALQAARRGRLEHPDAAYEENRLARCGYLPPAERPDCERRMRGEGTVTGSVEGGGIYRELRTEVPAPEGEASAGSGVLQRR